MKSLRWKISDSSFSLLAGHLEWYLFGENHDIGEQLEAVLWELIR